ADIARGDDITSLKFTLVSWLMQTSLTLNSIIFHRNKFCLRFYHNTTEQLLCPVNYNWDDAAIWNYHPDYCAMFYSWPSYLYSDRYYNPKNPMKGLFKDELLMKAVKHIFTSPSSAE
ncbi:uncharacterized protein F5147DRAFT_559345, partial [Suillus discolor]